MPRLLILSATLTLAALHAAADDPQPTLAALRDKVLKATTPDDKAAAYKNYFKKVGRKGLEELTKDKDTGIALQAAWETNKKVIERPVPLPHRHEHVYESGGLKRFVGAVEVRTGVTVPGWWAAAVVDVDVLPVTGHSVAVGSRLRDWGLKRAKAEKYVRVPEADELDRAGDVFTYRAGARSVSFSASDVDVPLFHDAVAGVLTPGRSALAMYDLGSGHSFWLVGLNGGGQRDWRGKVWGAGRTFLAGLAPHRVTLFEKNGTLFVFGAEGGGAYVEAFDMATGKNVFRFCTGYWFHFSEAWGLK